MQCRCRLVLESLRYGQPFWLKIMDLQTYKSSSMRHKTYVVLLKVCLCHRVCVMHKLIYWVGLRNQILHVMALHRLPSKPSEKEKAQLLDLVAQVQTVRLHYFLNFKEAHLPTENNVNSTIAFQSRRRRRRYYQADRAQSFRKCLLYRL